MRRVTVAPGAAVVHGGCSRPRGAIRRGRAAAPSAPTPPLVVLPLNASALIGMRARRASRPPPLSAFRLFRPRRPRLRSWRRGRGEKACAPAPRCRCAPPLASACRDAGAGVGGRPLRQAPAIPFFSVGGGWLLRGHSAAAAPPPGQSCGH